MRSRLRCSVTTRTISLAIMPPPWQEAAAERHKLHLYLAIGDGIAGRERLRGQQLGAVAVTEFAGRTRQQREAYIFRVVGDDRDAHRKRSVGAEGLGRALGRNAEAVAPLADAPNPPTHPACH